MDLDTFQNTARSTARYPNLGSNTQYPTLGLAGEAGEIMEKQIVAHLSGTAPSKADQELLSKEFGDVLWYAASLSSELGRTLSAVAGCGSFQGLGLSSRSADPLVSAMLLGAAVGAVAERAKKVERDLGGVLDESAREAFIKALSFALHRLADLAHVLDVDLEKAAQQNADKLADRARRSVLHGSGDTR